MDEPAVRAWIEAYERAWRSPGVDALNEVFTEDATYLQGPYREPVVGLPDIGRMWEATREGPDEIFRLWTEIVAVDGDTAVVRAEVHYGDPVTQEYRDLWIVRLDDDGRCRAFEEWPHAPGR
ncbi:nuclear transport factor 2 family protein [Jiangella aurantiaca]|uniref:Nuclear transport factor 2 family protein n=1 Tax=Jiangella aurantiaca TaxID=2530373 RepID=A0A4R5AE04_9ACTN|nr:nuclear transport factor 2 family protein [Jiangella aurantiaca]TDD69520.1 nuclear transport factor 2 family protein [Jiangella aurantiaca]